MKNDLMSILNNLTRGKSSPAASDIPLVSVLFKVVMYETLLIVPFTDNP